LSSITSNKLLSGVRASVELTSKPAGEKALQLENDHLNGIIYALNLKLKKTDDLEKELASLRNALTENEQARHNLR